MELALSLGDNTNKQFSFLEKPSKINNPSASSTSTSDKDLGFCIGFGGHRSLSSSSSPSVEDEKKKPAPRATESNNRFRVSSSVDPPLQLQLHFPNWLPENSKGLLVYKKNKKNGLRLISRNQKVWLYVPTGENKVCIFTKVYM